MHRVDGAGVLGEVRIGARATVLTLHGDLDLMTVNALRDRLDQLIATPTPHIVIDLSDVAFVDVMSLSVILGGADDLRDAGRQLVVRGASTAVRRICALLNAEDVLAPALPMPRSALGATPGR